MSLRRTRNAVLGRRRRTPVKYARTVDTVLIFVTRCTIREREIVLTCVRQPLGQIATVCILFMTYYGVHSAALCSCASNVYQVPGCTLQYSRGFSIRRYPDIRRCPDITLKIAWRDRGVVHLTWNEKSRLPRMAVS